MKKLLVAFLLASGCGTPPTGLKAHQPARVAGAVDQGPIAPDTMVELVVGVKLRDPSGLQTMLASLERGQERALRPAEFADRFGASTSDYQRVVDWARSNGLEVVRTVDGRSTVSVRGRADDVERAFGTRLHQFVDARGSFRAPTAELDLGAISGLVSGVVGLDDAERWFSHRIAPPPAATPDAVPPTGAGQSLQSIYGFNAVSLPGGLGAGQTVGILGTGYPPDLTLDVAGYVKKYALGVNVPAQYTQVFVGGPNRDPDSVANNEYGENLLDVDMVMGLAPAADVVHVFTATNAPGLFSDGITFFVNQVPQAHAVSVSYGSCERVAIGEVNVLDALFQQAKAEGQQWFFASGDDGTDGCRDGTGNDVLSVNWPASSPYAFGVGGTELSGSSESAWSSGGGGQSEIEPKPAFQNGVGPYPNDGARDVPDVAALAGNPGVVTYAQGQVFPSEGTSAATPMWAAAWAVLHQAKLAGSTVNSGFTDGAEHLYQLGQSAPTSFHDITTGQITDVNTAGYNALPGYDLATGWGSINLPNLIANW